MKLSYLLLPAALLLVGCQTDSVDENFTPTSVPTVQPSLSSTTTTNFPKPDGAQALSANGSQAVWQILQKVNPKQALEMGETEITDAQFAEIKDFVDKNLKDEGEYKTYRNIFNWITKNMSYAWSEPSYLLPYEVFKNKRCVCQGYANLLKTMLLTQGIPCFIANGWLNPIGGHAWNYVYADGQWYVSDPTNNAEYKASNLSSYQETLVPIRMDFTLFEDDHFTYSYLNSRLNVQSIKSTTDESVMVPYSINGLQVSSFQPTEKIPDCITQLIVGRNITTFGDNPENLIQKCPYLEEVQVDPQNTELESYKGVVYYKGQEYPYYVPSGIRRVELRAMETISKNTLYYLNQLEEIVVAEGTKRIEDYAIERCPNLKRVYVTSTVTYISPQAISECGNDYEIVRTTTGIHEVTIH